MSKSELKPCPFYGGRAHFVKYRENTPREIRRKFRYEDFGYISCRTCGANNLNFSFLTANGRSQTREEAPKAWNRRTPDEQIQP